MKYLDYVNVKQGTLSVPRYSNGNTLPLTQWPYGMAAFAPQTDGSTPWWYHPLEPAVEGIRLTHQPSPWIRDYGTLLIAPQADVILDSYKEGWSGYDPKQAVLRPDYLKLRFLRSLCTVELCPGKRGAYMRMTFEKEWFRTVTLYGLIGTNHLEYDAAAGIVRGWTDGCDSCSARDFRMYFVLLPQTDWPDSEKTRIVRNDSNEAAIHIALKEHEKTAEFVLGISYISYEQAVINARDMLAGKEEQLNTACGGKCFETVRARCQEAWEEYLSRIVISGDDEKLKTFYSCMYRTGLFPHMAYEITADGRKAHYSPYTGQIHEGIRYTDNGFWDTYRTTFPLYAMINKPLYRDMLESVLHDYEEGGWLPRWTAMGESGCMPSTLLDSVIAQAVVEGIVDRNLARKLLNGMLHHANTESPQECFGRTGIKEYLQYGYVPCDLYKESVNLTLDFAYGDYCIAKVAEVLGEKQIHAEYMIRSGNYRNLFDPATGFMRAKKTDGTFKEPFDPDSWGADYTEASAWQTTFSVPHDLNGLCELIGGRDALLQRLDTIMNREPVYRVGGYGKEIHEMTEMSLTNMGMCEMNNQPGFSLPYLYAFFGEKEKSAALVQKICEEQFSSDIDGFPGDEDNGSTAAWYILSTIGKYPVCPGDSTWVEITK